MATASAASEGAFKRGESGFRDFVKPGGKFEPESAPPNLQGGRYHLYIAYACPWANRCLAALYMKGLEGAIGLSVVHPTWKQTRPGKDEHRGWAFAWPGDEPFKHPYGEDTIPCDDACIPDTVLGAKFVRDIYDFAQAPPGTTFSVPILWDKNQRTIVNNESSEILRILNSGFNAFAKNPDLDLYPEEMRPAIDEVNSWVYTDINNGVYKCGFARRQAPYEEAFHALFAALDKVEAILGKQRYIAGDKLTEADVRLFMTLIRFDPVYVVYFKTNKKFIHQYPLMSDYVRELYQTPGIKGLEGAIGLSVVHPTWQPTRPGQDDHRGWTFAWPGDEPFKHPNGEDTIPCDDACIPDTVLGAKFVRDIYDMAGAPPGTKYSVPVLWDKKTRTIVNTESSEIMRILNSSFNDFAKKPDLDFYPEAMRSAIDEVNSWVFPDINSGVYKCGFAKRQAPYEEAFHALFAALDKVEAILGKQKYIAGDKLTEADVRLFMTLIRFDPVYVVYFKLNKKFIHQYPLMSDYVRELYQTPGIKESVNMKHIRVSYFTAHPNLNYYGIVPIGCDAWWEDPHSRT